MSTTITLCSSHGDFVFDAAGNFIEKHLNKYVVEGFEGYKEEDHPYRLDIAGHIKFYNDFDPTKFDSAWDILDWGYWTKDGRYEPPCKEWREDVIRLRKEAAEDEKERHNHGS